MTEACAQGIAGKYFSVGMKCNIPVAYISHHHKTRRQ